MHLNLTELDSQHNIAKLVIILTGIILTGTIFGTIFDILSRAVRSVIWLCGAL